MGASLRHEWGRSPIYKNAHIINTLHEWARCLDNRQPASGRRGRPSAAWIRGTHAFLRAEFWVPLETAERAGLVRLADRRGNTFRTLGRLAPGVTLAQAS